MGLAEDGYTQLNYFSESAIKLALTWASHIVNVLKQQVKPLSHHTRSFTPFCTLLSPIKSLSTSSTLRRSPSSSSPASPTLNLGLRQSCLPPTRHLRMVLISSFHLVASLTKPYKHVFQHLVLISCHSLRCPIDGRWSPHCLIELPLQLQGCPLVTQIPTGLLPFRAV